MDRLGLTDEELCAVLDVDPIAVIAGELDHRPELPILLVLTAEASEAVGPASLRRWGRRGGRPGGAASRAPPERPRRAPGRLPARARLRRVRGRRGRAVRARVR